MVTLGKSRENKVSYYVTNLGVNGWISQSLSGGLGQSNTLQLGQIIYIIS